MNDSLRIHDPKNNDREAMLYYTTCSSRDPDLSTESPSPPGATLLPAEHQLTPNATPAAARTLPAPAHPAYARNED